MTTPEQEPLNAQDSLAAAFGEEVSSEEHNLNTELNEKIASLQKELAEVQARANAEMYNYKNRLERESENTKKYALEKFTNGLLEVVDNLERAIDAATEDNAMLEGVKLTHKALLATLEKQGVSVVNPINEEFNADTQQAVGIDPEAKSNQVGKVLQKGYTLNGRLLRPAMVLVGA